MYTSTNVTNPAWKTVYGSYYPTDMSCNMPQFYYPAYFGGALWSNQNFDLPCDVSSTSGSMTSNRLKYTMDSETGDTEDVKEESNAEKTKREKNIVHGSWEAHNVKKYLKFSISVDFVFSFFFWLAVPGSFWLRDWNNSQRFWEMVTLLF